MIHSYNISMLKLIPDVFCSNKFWVDNNNNYCQKSDANHWMSRITKLSFHKIWLSYKMSLFQWTRWKGYSSWELHFEIKCYFITVVYRLRLHQISWPRLNFQCRKTEKLFFQHYLFIKAIPNNCPSLPVTFFYLSHVAWISNSLSHVLKLIFFVDKPPHFLCKLITQIQSCFALNFRLCTNF